MDRFGLTGRLYHSATAIDGTNTPGATTWTEFEWVKDLTGNYSAVNVDTTNRQTAKLGWTTSANPLKAGEITFQMPNKSDASDTANTTIRDAIIQAWLNNTKIAFMQLDGPLDAAAGESQGLAANFYVQMSRNEPLQDEMTYDVTLTVADYPSWQTSPVPDP